ncbi:Protein of unknown function [Pyronema omphalodes CBS 100304]|uniref:Uncharacterized protein n=1 Tax=Pyronema omphalodes (strain CBS 100304) TaxID=1076935 RepID=U4LJF4_PYROM|nr:Protein of unknown function [Pyronema omphalodes CBS 100304]
MCTFSNFCSSQNMTAYFGDLTWRSMETTVNYLRGLLS